MFNFPTIESFLAATSNGFNITVGERRSVIDQRPQAQLRPGPYYTVHDRFTLELGIRYEWHVSPTERDDRFVVFDADSGSLVPVGTNAHKNFSAEQSELTSRDAGIAWDLTSDGRTVLRASYARAVDQPVTTAVRGYGRQSAIRRAAYGSRLDSSRRRDRHGTARRSLPPPRSTTAVTECFASVVERQHPAATRRGPGRDVWILGSHGTRTFESPGISINRSTACGHSPPWRPPAPFFLARRSATSPRWRAAGSRTTTPCGRPSPSASRAVCTLDASYTWSKSLDTNSLNSSGFAVQDGYDIPNQYGLSDFDARHRFVVSATYVLPFTGHVLTRGWQLATVVQSQSGNPVNIVTSNSSLNGVPNTVRPDVTGPIRIIGSVDQWFDPSVFVAVNHFGNLGRNVVIGPGFNNVDRVVDQERAARTGALACSFEWTRSTCSTIPTSARRAISSAARRSARLRGRDCPRAKRAHPARFNWPCGCRSEMEVRMRARVRARARRDPVCVHASRVSRGTGRITANRADDSLGRRELPGQSHSGCGHPRGRLARSSDVPIDYFAEYLESDLFPGEEASLAFRDYLRRKYQGRTIDVVIAMTDTSLRFVLDHRGRAVSRCASHFLRARRPGRDHPQRRRRHHGNNESALHTPRR